MMALDILSNTFGKQEGYQRSFSDGPKREKGQLFFQIDLPDNPGAEDAVSEKIWRALHDTYYNCSSDDPYLCFEEALKQANQVLDKEKRKREDGTLGRVHSMVALIHDGNLHFSQTGAASVYLQRSGSLTPISVPEDGDQSVFSDVLSGDLIHADVIILSTQPLAIEHQDLHNMLFEEPQNILSQLKQYSKKHSLEGMVSCFRFQETDEQAADDASGADEEELTEAVAEEAPEEEEKGSSTPSNKLSSAKGIQSLAKHLNKDKIAAARKTMSGVFSGVGSKMGKIVRKPSALKEVNRRSILLGLILVVFVFGAFILYQSSSNQDQQQADLYSTLLSQVKNNISIAEQRFLIGQKADATDFLNKAAASLDEIAAANFYQEDVSQLKNEIALFRDNFDAIIRVTEPNVLADLSAKGSADALGFIHTEDDKNVVYEPKRVFETFLDKVQDPQVIDSLDGDDLVIAGWELEDFKVLSFVTQNGQVLEYSMRNGTFEQMNTLDTTWNRGVDIKTFHGEYIYLLDTSTNTIWRYQRLRNSYSKPTPWSTGTDLSDAVSMAIDGDIYVLNRDGEIMRFRKGELTPFTITDQPTVALKNPSRIYTFAEALNVYVLDSANKRVVVYSKGQGDVGRYLKQIVFENFSENEIRDISVDKDEQKLTLMTGDKLYITDL